MILRKCGIIFDLDDTLIVSEPLWRPAEETLLRAIGQTWSRELAIKYKGMNALDVAAAIHQLFQPDRPLKECQTMMRDALIANFNTLPIQPRPGAVGCVRRMKTIAPLAVASGSPQPAIEIALNRLGLQGVFSVVLSSESVARGKPYPDVFLAAAAALQVAPENCLVFEDSLVGVQAAKAAGMASFAVPSSHPQEIRRLATRVFGSLAKVGKEEARSELKQLRGKPASWKAE